MQQLPYKEFTPDMIGNREVIRANSTRDEEIVKIPLDKIVIRHGFNVRGEDSYGDLEELGNSMLNNGQLQAGRVDSMKGGEFSIVDGHRRFKAWQLIAKRDNVKPFFKAVVNKKETTEEERLLMQFSTQEGKPLEQYEVAELFTRLINMGWKPVKIAERIGKSASYVSQMISFSKEPEAIKEQVRMGRLTVSNALKIKKEIPSASERAQRVSDAATKKFDDKVKRGENEDSKFEYDENLKRTKPSAPKDDPDNIIKKQDNTVKGKKLKLEEVSGAPVKLQSASMIKKKIEAIELPYENSEYNYGYAEAIKFVLSLF